MVSQPIGDILFMYNNQLIQGFLFSQISEPNSEGP